MLYDFETLTYYLYFAKNNNIRFGSVVTKK